MKTPRAVYLLLAATLNPLGLLGQSLSVSQPEADNSAAAQLASFQVAEGYEVNLFADESMGIANPVCFRWDAEGRLWVLCTWAYPQPKPGEKAADKLFILEDQDQDGSGAGLAESLTREGEPKEGPPSRATKATVASWPMSSSIANRRRGGCQGARRGANFLARDGLGAGDLLRDELKRCSRSPDFQRRKS